MPEDYIEHGVEVPVGEDPPKHKEPDKPPEKSEIDKLRDEFRKELESRDKRITELAASEKYWASKASRSPDPEPEADDEPEPEPDEKPEKLLDDLSSKGLKAITERGFVKRTDVERMVNARLNQTLAEVQEGQAFDARLQRDFPDLIDPKSDLFKRAGEHFREMVEVDPRAKGSRVALYAAAKLAAQSLEAEKAVAKKTDDREERRRQRIEDQSQERGRTRPSDDTDALEMSPQARQIVKNLERFGVTEEAFKSHQGGKRGR